MIRSLLSIVATLSVLVCIAPSQSFATSMKTSEAADEDSEESAGEEIIEAIFTLGGLLGSSGGSSSATPSTAEVDAGIEVVEFPEDNTLRSVDVGTDDRDVSAPIPEPSAALLFGFGMLATASRRSLRR